MINALFVIFINTLLGVKKSVPAPENGEYKLLNCPTVNYLVKIKFKIQDLVY